MSEKNPIEKKLKMNELLPHENAVRGLLPKHESPKINSEKLKQLLNGGKEWKDQVPGGKIEAPIEKIEEETTSNIFGEESDTAMRKKGGRLRAKETDEPLNNARRKPTEKESIRILETEELEEQQRKGIRKPRTASQSTTPENKESRIEKFGKLSFRELADIMSIRVNDLERKIKEGQKIDKEQLEEKLQEFSEMKEVAEDFLRNKENFKSFSSSEKNEAFIDRLESAKKEVIEFLERFSKEEIDVEKLTEEKMSMLDGPIVDLTELRAEEIWPRIKQLSLKGLTITVKKYIAKINSQLEKLDLLQREIEKYRMKDIGELIKHNLANAPMFAKNSDLSPEQQQKITDGLKSALENLRDLYRKISPKKEKQPSSIDESLKELQKKTVVDISENKTEEPKMEESQNEANQLNAENEKLITEIRDLINRLEHEAGKINPEQLEKELHKMADMGKTAENNLERTDEIAKRKGLGKVGKKIGNELNREVDNLKELYDSLKESIKKTVNEIPKAEGEKQKTEKKEKVFEDAFEGFTGGEKTADETILAEINEKIKQKEQEIERAEQKMAIYRPAGGLFRKKPVVRDLGYYAIDAELKKLKLELDKLEDKKANLKVKIALKQYEPEQHSEKESAKIQKKIFKEMAKDIIKEQKVETSMDDVLKEVVIMPKEKKKGFFKRIFSKKPERKLTEKELLRAVNKHPIKRKFWE